VPDAARTAIAAASRPKGRIAVLAAALLLLTLALASSAGASVYWGNPIGAGNSIGTTIGRANDDGTGINPSFIGGASEPTGVAVDAAHVYWINELDHSIGRANLDGTEVDQRLVTGVNGDALAVDGAHIYWTNIIAIAPQDAADDAIGRANLDGTGVDQNFITGAVTPEGVAVDRAHVYWTNSDRHAIGRANLDGSDVNQSFSDVGFGRLPVGIAVDGTHIYWANINANTIGRANLDGTGVNQSFIEGAALPFGVAVDSAHLYWTNQFPSPDGTDGGTIGRATLDGTGMNQKFIAGFTGDPIGVAVAPAAQTDQAASISIDDVTMAEGDAGQTAFRFTASLDSPQPAAVTVGFATGDATATAPSDYAASTGTVTFAPGDTSQPVTVQVNGDTTVENNETFNLNLANATGNATIADAQGIGRVVSDDRRAASISLDDVTATETDSGETAFRFTASLDTPQPAPVTVGFATADGTATAAGDYAANTGTVTFAPGDTSQPVTVQVNGDITVEPDETFDVNLANPTGNATIADARGVGTVINDDRAPTEQPANVRLDDVRLNEGGAGQTAFRFTVSLDTPQSAAVTVDFATGDGTATAPSDYAASTGTVSFVPGDTSETVTVQVNGDRTVESNERFDVNLSDATGNATIADTRGVGTIGNDDRKARSNKFTLGRPRLNRKTGTATLAVTVLGPGKLALSGNGVKAPGTATARAVRAAGTVRLLIKATGKKQRKLNQTGNVTIRPKITYTPIGGTPRTRSRTVRLKKL
jgi:hypothetical protein